MFYRIVLFIVFIGNFMGCFVFDIMLIQQWCYVEEGVYVVDIFIDGMLVVVFGVNNGVNVW